MMKHPRVITVSRDSVDTSSADVQAEVEVPPLHRSIVKNKRNEALSAEDIESLLGNVEAMSGELQRSMKHSDSNLGLDASGNTFTLKRAMPTLAKR